MKLTETTSQDLLNLLSIDAMTQYLEDENIEQPDIPMMNYVANGLYVRQMKISKGVFVTGAKHRKGCIDMCFKGELILIYDDGRKKYVKAPYIEPSEAEIQRCAYAIKDSIFMTIHPTDADNEQDAVEDCFYATLDTLGGGENNKQFNNNLEALQ